MKTTLRTLIALTLFAGGSAASAGTPISVSTRILEVTDTFFERIGVDFDLPGIEVDLPERAAEAVNDALNRAEVAIDEVFGEGGVLDGFDLPNVNVPQVSAPNVQQIIDDAIGRANGILGDLDLPSFDVPDVDAIVDGALNDAQDIVDNALGKAQDAVDSALEDARGVLDNLDGIVPNVEAILDDVLGETGVVEEVLADLPVGLPPAAVEALESLPIELPLSFASASFSSAPLRSAAAVAVPEPSAALLACLALGLRPRSRR